MMTPRDRVLTATAMAQGVILTMGALLRDMGIANMVDDGKTGKLDKVVSGTIHALNEVAKLWDNSPEAGGDDD